jgi:hypothetical protein
MLAPGDPLTLCEKGPGPQTGRAPGLVAAARTALGLDHAEFAALLEDALGLMMLPGVVGRWERESVPQQLLAIKSAVSQALQAEA